MVRQSGSKPLKRRKTKRRSNSEVTKRKAATPKAGPKKRRARAEVQEAVKQRAIADNTKKPTGKRRSSKVVKYNYRTVPSDKVRIPKPPQLQMRKPRNPEDIPSIIRWIDSHRDRFDSVIEAVRHFQDKVCRHGRSSIIAVTTNRARPDYFAACADCGRVESRRG